MIGTILRHLLIVAKIDKGGTGVAHGAGDGAITFILMEPVEGRAPRALPRKVGS